MERNADFTISFALSVLAVYRISYMMAKEEGPFSIFLSLRDAFDQSTWIGRGLNCPLCISVWISSVVASVMLYGTQDILGFIRLWLAIAGMCLIIHLRLQQR